MANYYFLMYTLIRGFPLIVYVLYSVGFFLVSYMLWWAGEFGLYICSFFFIILLLGFLCKLPLYGVHLWLPKAHVEAPVGRSMVLAGLLLKMRRYRLLRVGFLFKVEMGFFILVLLLLGCWRAFASIFACLRQLDLKCFIAYSSVSHISLSLLGVLSFGLYRMKGALYLFLGHRIVSPGMFFLRNLLYERLRSRVYARLRGLLKDMKVLGFYVMVFFCINIGFPPFMNFFRELCVYIGILIKSYSIVLILFMVIVISGLVIIKFFSKNFRSGGAGFLGGCLNLRENILSLVHLVIISSWSFFIWLI